MTRPAALLAATLTLISPAPAAELTVDLATPIKLVDHAASGSLYGLAAEGWPADPWIAAVRPKMFTQMAPGGTHKPNGEPAPIGDALVVAPIAARHGASITIRMPDIFPSFPYVWQGEDFWFAAVDRMVRATVAADPPNIYAYEIWNEADWNFKPAWGDFHDIWRRTYEMIRALDPGRAIMGPSDSNWDAARIRTFLELAIASGAVPDIISWHELDPRFANDLETHVAEYRAIEAELGIGPLPISINEYGAPRDLAVPGSLARLVSRLERAGVDTANLAFWHKPGRLADLIAPIEGGRGPARDAEPTGAFWVYKWYGDMAGDMVAVTPESITGPTLDGFAAYDRKTRTARIVVGGEAGDHRVVVTGLDWLSGVTQVQVFATQWTGTDGALAAPLPVFAETFTLVANSITVHLTAPTDREAFLILVAPPVALAPSIGPVERFSVRLEAEAAALEGARAFRIRMSPHNFFAPTVSGNAYAGILDRDLVSLGFEVEVPAAGAYELRIGYSSGLDVTATYYLSVPGSAEAMPVRFTPTQFRELIDEAKLTVMLPAGRTTLTLESGPGSPRGTIVTAPSVMEVDYLDVTAAN